MKRLLAFFLAVITVLTLVPATAFAASAKLIIVESGQQPKEVAMAASASGSGWSWDGAKKKLLLSGFNGESISAGGDMTLVLKGKNTITLAKRADFGIKVDGKLTIEKNSSSSTDTLTVLQKTTASSSNLILTGGVGEDKACVINGGTVTLTNSTGGGNGSGIGYQAIVNNDASLVVSVPYRGVAQKLTANTTGKIDITTTGNNAFAAAAFSLCAKGKGQVSLKATTPAVTVYDSVDIQDSSGTVKLDGFTRVSSNPLKSFKVAYNKHLSNSDSYYQGYYTSDASGNTGFFLTDSQGNPLSTATYVTAEAQKLTIMDSALFDLNELRVGTPVSTQVGLINATRGGAGDYRYYLKSGSKLPDGLTLNETTGAISGTPTKPCETGNFTVVCKDKKGASGCSSTEVGIKYSAVKASDEYITIGQFGTFNMNTNLSSQDYTWKYTAATKTLELKNYNGGPISADSGLNIVLSDSNRITLPGTAEYGIRVNGKLTIDKTTASVTDTLTILQDTTSTSANLIVTGGTGEAKACVINGGNIVLDCSSSSVNGVGVKYQTIVNGDALLTVKAGYRGVDDKLVANSSGPITIATLGLAEGSAAVKGLEAKGTSYVTLSAPAGASTVYDSLSVASTAGEVILAGYTKVAATPYQSYSLAANKQLVDNDDHAIDNYYLGHKALGPAGQGYYITDSFGTILPGVKIISTEYQPLTVMSSTLFNLGASEVGTKIDNEMYLLNATRGGVGNYTYTLKSGSIPAGLTLNEKTGGVSGIATAPCEPGAFTVTVRDKGGASGCSKVDVTITYGKIEVCDLGTPAPEAGNDPATGQNTLTWKTVPGAQKYEVWRATSKNGTYSKMSTTTKTTYTNTSSKVNTTYYYKVKAVGFDGATTVSGVVSRTCDCARPVVKLSNVSSSGKIKVTWTAVEGAGEYEVYRATSVGGTYKKMLTTKNTSYTNTSAAAGNKYYYKVIALSSKTASADSAYSEIVSRVCDCAQPVVKISNVSSSGKIKLTWAKVTGAAKYEVWRATSKTGTYTRMLTTTGTSYTNTSAVAGKTYYYKVKAIGSATTDANSVYSAVVYRCCDCGQPVVTITLSSKKPKLTWKAINGATSYEVWRATSKNGTYTKLYTTTKTSFTNTGASAGKSYFYKVRAKSSLSSSATSVYSTIVSITSK